MTAERPFRFRTQTSVTTSAPPDAVFDVIVDLRAHLVWSGERAEDPTFKLLTIDSSDDVVKPGTEFRSTGTNFNGTFHDHSIVREVVRPERLIIDTDARLERKRGTAWEVRFEHRYDVHPDGAGSRIVYTETISRVNYVPYWLKFWMRPLSRVIIDRADRKQLANLARLAEERSG